MICVNLFELPCGVQTYKAAQQLTSSLISQSYEDDVKGKYNKNWFEFTIRNGFYHLAAFKSELDEAEQNGAKIFVTNTPFLGWILYNSQPEEFEKLVRNYFHKYFHINVFMQEDNLNGGLSCLEQQILSDVKEAIANEGGDCGVLSCSSSYQPLISYVMKELDKITTSWRKPSHPFY